MKTKWISLMVGTFGVVGLAACADVADGPSPERLDQLVITDPNFDFSTSRAVRLELRAEEGAAPKAIEVADSEGRRLMDGAFRGSATIDLKVPVGLDRTLEVRVGKGQDAVSHDLAIGDDGRVVSGL